MAAGLKPEQYKFFWARGSGRRPKSMKFQAKLVFRTDFEERKAGPILRNIVVGLRKNTASSRRLPQENFSVRRMDRRHC